MQSEKSTWPHTAFLESVMTQDLTARPVLERKPRKQKTFRKDNKQKEDFCCKLVLYMNLPFKRILSFSYKNLA